ncbi:MAG: magnesium transporter [Bacteroidetes bacterium]|nr:magnesium transporter [Bacteroidota bacterium]
MEEIKIYNERVEKLIELDALDELGEFINDLNISDVGELINEYPDNALIFFNHLDFQRALAVFRILDGNIQEDLLTILAPHQMVQLLNELPPDDRTSLLAELPSHTVKEVIRKLNPEERKITLSLLGYPEESVGRLMTPDYIDVEPDWTVEQVLTYIRDYGKSSETIDVIYVTDAHGTLLDDIRIRDFLLVDPVKTKVQDLMDERFIALHVNDDQRETMNTFQMNNRVALPVVDDRNVLLGIVTIDDVLWVAEEEYSEDIQRIGGTEALNEPYLDIPLPKLIKKRVGWLVILFLGEMLTATAMAYFEDEISKAMVLVLFIPLIISSGGNTGSQASTLIIQAMALGEVTLYDWWRVIKRELISGVVLGTVLGIIGLIRVIFWNMAFHSYGDSTLSIGFTVGFSLLGVVLWGTLIGSMFPMFLKRLGADPAVSSAPFVATVIDVTGLVIYFSVALLFLRGILL